MGQSFLKASSETSARAKEAPRLTGRSSVRHRHTLTSADSFGLSGPSQLPDPGHHAYRKDLADVGLAGRVVASHYAEPVERVVSTAITLRESPSETSEVLRELAPGEPFAMLDDTLGWAWGYAGEERLVGFVRSDALNRRS